MDAITEDKTMSQNTDIAKHLKAGKVINPMIALKKFGCFRLASRICDLQGTLNIKSQLVVNNGKKYKEYWV